jgi:hypothetical protein
MPIKKARLSRAEQARHLARVQELRGAGVDCELPDELQEKAVHDLDIFVAPSHGNILCEISPGFTAYAIWVRLIALRSNVRLENCKIVSDWDLESIVLCQSQKGQYRVGQAVDFPEDDVLNHRIERGLRFHHRGDVAEGWVVASGLKLIPDTYRNWMITRLSLAFTDQFGCEHTTKAEAILQRVRSGGVPTSKYAGQQTCTRSETPHLAHPDIISGVRGKPTLNGDEEITITRLPKPWRPPFLEND